MGYAEQWRLAGALKQAYPALSETGEVGEKSSVVGYVVVFALAAVVGGFVGKTWGEDMRRSGIDPDAAHMRGIYD